MLDALQRHLGIAVLRRLRNASAVSAQPTTLLLPPLLYARMHARRTYRSQYAIEPPARLVPASQRVLALRELQPDRGPIVRSDGQHAAQHVGGIIVAPKQHVRLRRVEEQIAVLLDGAAVDEALQMVDGLVGAAQARQARAQACAKVRRHGRVVVVVDAAVLLEQRDGFGVAALRLV